MKKLYKNLLTTLLVAFVGVSTLSTAYSKDRVTVNENETIIIVNGIVCSFCSQGVTKKLSKLPFIDSSKYTDGIKVDIENQKVIVAIKSGAHADFEKIFASIQSGGYEPITAHTFDGQIITPEDK